MGILKKQIDGGLTIDLTRGINPFLGLKDSVVIRNGHSFGLDNGLPGTGVFKMKKESKSDTPLMFIIAVMIVLGFGMLTLAAIHSQYSVEKFLNSFFSGRNIIYISLFVIINISAIFVLYRYKMTLSKLYLNYLQKLEDERQLVYSAMEATEGMKHDILCSYFNCLEIEKELVETETIVCALQYYHGAKYFEASKRYLSKFDEQQQRLQAARYPIDKGLSEQEGKNFRSLCESFEILSGARFWDISKIKDPFSGHKWQSTLFYTGIFDYILSASYPPLLKTVPEGMLMIYSKYAVLARTTTDFDIYPLSDIHMEYDSVPGNRHFEVLRIPELNLTFTSSDITNVKVFVESFEAYKQGKFTSDDFRQLDSLLEEVTFYYILKRKLTNDMIRSHFNIGRTRTRRILSQLEHLGIISKENQDGMHELIVWDIERVRNIIESEIEKYSISKGTI